MVLLSPRTGHTTFFTSQVLAVRRKDVKCEVEISAFVPGCGVAVMKCTQR